jgi:hypothetical protein
MIDSSRKMSLESICLDWHPACAYRLAIPIGIESSTASELEYIFHEKTFPFPRNRKPRFCQSVFLSNHG